MTFVPMVDVIPEGRSDDCSIEHFNVTEKDFEFSKIQAMQHGPSTLVSPGRYARLNVGRALMMSDTPAEQRSNRWFVSMAAGDVLIAGLGLGMVLIPVLRKRDVQSVTVIEKHQGVIDLVEGGIRAKMSSSENNKLLVICEDIFDWKLPPRSAFRLKDQNTLVGRWHTIYFDIWPDACGDNLEEITKLKRRFARRLRRDDPNSWMGAWEEDRLRHERARELQ